MKNLILVRGVSGAGKSTIAELYGVRVYSADDFFLNAEGEYVFDRTKLSMAHKYCQDVADLAMSQEHDLVVVANTFTTAWEMKSYLSMAEKYDYRVHTIIVENRHGSKSIHDVPVNILANQRDRFEVIL